MRPINSVLVLGWAHAGIIAMSLFVGAALPGLRDSVIRKRLNDIDRIKKSGLGIAVGFIYGLISLISLPAGILHSFWMNDHRGPSSEDLDEAGRQAMRNRIDLWVFTWLAINLVLLLSGIASTFWVLALLPIIRIIDITYALLLVLILPRQSTSPSFARPLILLLIHLLEITISFGVFYQLACAAGNLKVDGVVCPCLGLLQGLDALYFSLVTAATVGYGDIVPLNSAKWIAVTQILLSLFLTLISIPRVFSNYPARPADNPPQR